MGCEQGPCVGQSSHGECDSETMSNLVTPILETQEPIATRKSKRNTRFDFLRIVFSILVVFSHASQITDGNFSREYFYRITRGTMTFGELAVCGFFLLSGFLIVQSWDRKPEIIDYLKKRILRIVPGYIVAAILSVVVVGLLAPGEPHYFAHLPGAALLKSLLTLGVPKTPAVLPGNHYALVNASMWTIPYEFQCYLIVALAGCLGFIRRRALWLAATALLIAAIFLRPLEHRHVYGLIGVPQHFLRTNRYVLYRWLLLPVQAPRALRSPGSRLCGTGNAPDVREHRNS
jgi:peptidoglycan/LPS O-acetylase OafA/YrhL